MCILGQKAHCRCLYQENSLHLSHNKKLSLISVLSFLKIEKKCTELDLLECGRFRILNCFRGPDNFNTDLRHQIMFYVHRTKHYTMTNQHFIMCSPLCRCLLWNLQVMHHRMVMHLSPFFHETSRRNRNFPPPPQTNHVVGHVY